MRSRRTVLSSVTFSTLAAVALSVPVACDDPGLPVDEAVLLSDDADAVDAALEAAEQLSAVDEAEEAGVAREGAVDQLSSVDPEPQAAVNGSTIWGVEYNGSITKLFRYNLDGTDYTVVGDVKRAGLDVEIGGLAENATGTLYAFVINGTGSRLVTIDKTTGVATNAPNALSNRTIRGAAAFGGKIWALDVQNSQVLAVNADGTVEAGSAENLTLGGNPFSLGGQCDIARALDGQVWITSGGTLYKLNIATGQLSGAVDASGAEDYLYSGAAFSASTPGSSNYMVVLDARLTDEIRRVHLPNNGTALLKNDVVSGHDQGGGDLAVKPPSVSCSAPSITNASFETAGPSGWTVENIDHVSFWDDADGLASVDLNKEAPGSVSQALATTAGVTYRVTFALAGNPTCDVGSKSMQVTADGSQADTYSFNTTGKTYTSMGWVDETYFFTAVDSSTVLKFKSLSSGACGPVIDHIRIACL